jgi:hypothetical protein
MLGVQTFPNYAPRVRKNSLTLLAIAASAAAFFAVTAPAQAQECVGGYRMVKEQIPVPCSGDFGSTAFAPIVGAPTEPLHTGSINREEPRIAQFDSEPAVTTSSTGQECVGGYSYRETPANGWTLPMRC